MTSFPMLDGYRHDFDEVCRRTSVKAVSGHVADLFKGEGYGLFRGCGWHFVREQPLGLRQAKEWREALLKAAAKMGWPGGLNDEQQNIDAAMAETWWRVAGHDLPAGWGAEPGFWRWVSLRLMPDLVVWRWALSRYHGDEETQLQERRKVLQQRLTSTAGRRCWPMNLHWLAWLCADDGGELDLSLLQQLKPTDMQLNVIERPGMGYDRPMIQAILRCLHKPPKVSLPAGRLRPSLEDVRRGMLVRLSWERASNETSFLDGDARETFVKALYNWSMLRYRGRSKEAKKTAATD